MSNEEKRASGGKDSLSKDWGVMMMEVRRMSGNCVPELPGPCVT